jgi:hypothetical protein
MPGFLRGRGKFMGFLATILRALAPIALEHGTPLLRDWWKARAAQPKTAPDTFQQLAGDIEQLKSHAEQVDSNLGALNANLERLNDGLTAREERLRRWLLVLAIWNVVTTLGLLLEAFAFRKY